MVTEKLVWNAVNVDFANTVCTSIDIFTAAIFHAVTLQNRVKRQVLLMDVHTTGRHGGYGWCGQRKPQSVIRLSIAIIHTLTIQAARGK